MILKRVQSYAMYVALLIAAIPWSASEATVMWEEDFRMICNETGRKSLPKKMTIRQVIDDSFFSDAAEINAVMFASYLFRVDVDKGKVIVTGVVLKSDGSEVALPRLARKVKDGDAEKHRSTDAGFEPGDVIEWKVKLKGLAPLDGFDCWVLEVGIVSTDSGFVLSDLMSISSVTKTKK